MATVSIERYIDVFEHDFKIFQEACTCVLEMIIRKLSLNHMLTKMLHRSQKRLASYLNKM